MAEPAHSIRLTITPPDLNLQQEWSARQDRRDELEFAAVIEGGGQKPGSAPTDKGGGADVAPPDPAAVLAEKPVKKAVDTLTQYREMRAAEGPEGGVYDASKLGRSGWKDEVAKDPVAALMKLVDEVTRSSSPDIKGGAPGTPGDAKNIAKSLKTAGEALKKMTGAGAGGEVAKTNLARVDASQSVKDTMLKLNQQFGQARKTTTHTETVEGSQGALSLDEALATPDAAWSLEEMRHKQQALRDLDVGMAAEATKLQKMALAGDETAADAYLDTALIAAVLGNKNRMVGKGAGQLLEARKILADAERAGLSTRDLTNLVERLGIEGVTSIDDIARVKAQMLAEGIDGMTLARMMEQVPRGQRKPLMSRIWEGYKTANDAAHWLFLQSLLSNPVTHAANVLGTGAAIAYHYPERYLAEWVSKAFRTGPEGVQRGETWAMMQTFGKAVTDGIRMMGRAITKGERPFGTPGHVETRFDLSAAQFGWDPNTPAGKLVDTVGMVAPTRLMMGEDGFLKGFSKTQELGALALREGMARATPGESLADLASRIGRLEAKPTTEMVHAAEAAANLRTLNAELGVAGKAMMTARNVTPGAFYVAPFMQTPTNSIKWFWQRAPVLSLFSVQNIKDLAAGGAARNLAWSRILLGHAIGGAVAYQVVQGNITGALPVGSNKNLKRDLRELGPREFTIRVGDEYFGYKRTDPIGGYIGVIATGIEIYSQLHHDDPDAAFDYFDFAQASALAAGRVALDTQWLQGLSNVFDAIEKPDTEGKKVAMGFARSLVPAGVRKGTETGFQFSLTEPRPEVRELETLLDVVKSGFPWLVDGVAPVLHPITGETIIRPPGWGPDMLSPIFVSRRNNDPVLLQIIQHGMEFREPKKMIYGAEKNELALDPTRNPDGVKLTQGQYFRLKQLATTDLQDGRGRTMHEAMVDQVATEGYKNDSPGPDNGKEYRLKLIYREFYGRAERALLKEYPELDRQVRDKRELRIRQRLPETSPNAAPVQLAPGLVIPGAKP